MLRATRYGDVTRFDLGRSFMGRCFYWTTAYLVDDLLIDTGCAFSARELLDTLAGRRLQGIINTHTHEDHIGANGSLQQSRPELPVLAHPAALPVLEHPRQEQPLHPYRRIMWGWPQPCRARAVADGEEISTGKRSLQVVFTPGHSPDHLCLWAPDEGWLFTGDLFVGGYDRALRVDCDIRGIISSLRRIDGLAATTMFPGSARVREQPAEAIADKIAYLERLGEQVHELHGQGRSTAQIVRALCGGPMFIELFTLGHFTRSGLVRSYLGL